MMEDEKEDKVLDTSRKQSANRKKLYEEMMLKEIPGTCRTDEVMHAVIEDELGAEDTSNVRNHALIHYIATLANENRTDDIFDINFVGSLVINGADINSPDRTGQTIFHEVARSWNIDVARFIIKNGANINKQDQFGRSPLHVAAAVDYAEMVEFLLQNGADIAITTCGEEQTAVHYAAKNGAINSLQMLLGYGANIDARDSKNRTPLQVSAEMNRSKAAKLLISEGAPAGVYDNAGNSALSLLIEKIPEVALEALDQFHSSDTINRQEFYFLNYLEGMKLNDSQASARSPLEIAVQNQRFDIILHPVMQRLITVKWKMYAKRGAVWDLVLNLFYTILWTVIGVTIPRHGSDLYFPLKDHIWRLVVAALLILLTLYEIKTQVRTTVKGSRELEKWREWRAAELERDNQYCHPQWPQETIYLHSEIDAVRNLSLISSTDAWIYFDWISLILVLASIGTHVSFFYYSTDLFKEIHHYAMIPLLMVLWFRMFKYARPFEGAGPFVVIFGSVLDDIVKWGFLNSLIIIPFTCAFWITFGAISLHPVKGFNSVGPLMYNMFSMMVSGDPRNFDDLVDVNPVLSRLLCLGFIGIVAIVTVNLLIALLTNTFERHYENAVANAIMQRARTIIMLEKWLTKKQLTHYYNFIRKNGSPETIQVSMGQVVPSKPEDRANMDRACDDLRMIKGILFDRFGKRYGKGKSHLDIVEDDLITVKKLQQELVNDMKCVKMILQGMVNHVDNNNNSNNNNSNNNNNDNDNNDDNNNNNSSSRNNNDDNNNNNNNRNNNDDNNNNSRNNDDNNNNNNNRNNNDDNNNNNNNRNNNDDNNNNNNSSRNNNVDDDNMTNIPTRESSLHHQFSPRVQARFDHQTTSPSRKLRRGFERSYLEETQDHSHHSLPEDLDAGRKRDFKPSTEQKDNHRPTRKSNYHISQQCDDFVDGNRDYSSQYTPHIPEKSNGTHQYYQPVITNKQPDFGARPRFPYSAAAAIPTAIQSIIPKPTQTAPYYPVDPLVHQPKDHRGSPGYLVQQSRRPQPYLSDPAEHYVPAQGEEQIQGYRVGRRHILPENVTHYPSSNYDQHIGQDYYRKPVRNNEMLSSDITYDDNQRHFQPQDYSSFKEIQNHSFQQDERNGQRSKNFFNPLYLHNHASLPVPTHQNAQGRGLSPVPSIHQNILQQGSTPVPSYQNTLFQMQGSSPVPSHQNPPLQRLSSSPVSRQQGAQRRGSSPVPSHQNPPLQVSRQQSAQRRGSLPVPSHQNTLLQGQVRSPVPRQQHQLLLGSVSLPDPNHEQTEARPANEYDATGALQKEDGENSASFSENSSLLESVKKNDEINESKV